MTPNQFFVKKGPFPLKDIVKSLDCNVDFGKKNNFKIYGIESLLNAKSNDMTFLSSNKYKEVSLQTKASACITSDNLSKFLPEKCIKIKVKNIHFAVTQVSRMFYPDSDIDYPDMNVVESKKIKNRYKKVFFGQNVLLGKNVEIGKNTIIGNYSIIESNVKIGKECIIGSMVTIKNSIIGDHVHIKDDSKIGTKGFGFIPIKNKNLRTPQVGKVILEDGVEIGANCTVDRGSVENTVIGKNTFLDNLIQIGHNARIGKNCSLAAQIALAGSAIVGDNVLIGGQSGISGHIRVGDNVKIGGASAVISDIPANAKVMGNPAISFKEFVKLRKKI